MDGRDLPRVVRQRLRVVHQWEMGGLGSAVSGIPRFAGYSVGNGLRCRKRKQEAKGANLWKREEQRQVYVTTVVENRRKGDK